MLSIGYLLVLGWYWTMFAILSEPSAVSRKLTLMFLKPNGAGSGTPGLGSRLMEYLSPMILKLPTRSEPGTASLPLMLPSSTLLWTDPSSTSAASASVATASSKLAKSGVADRKEPADTSSIVVARTPLPDGGGWLSVALTAGAGSACLESSVIATD